MAASKTTKIIDDSYELPIKRGNGILRREIWIDENGTIVRYNLAYINHNMFQGDNGRLVGYDNAHQFHHRHYLGKVEPAEFTSFDDIEQKFEADWTFLRSANENNS
jgi:hypothetical protein